MMKELDQKFERIRLSIEKEQNRLRPLKENTEELNIQAEHLIKCNDAEKVFKESKKLGQALNEVVEPLEIKIDSMPKFVPDAIPSSCLGSLKRVTTKISLQFIKEFTTDLGVVFDLAAHPDGSLWICDNSVTVAVQKVKPEGNKLKVLNSYNMQVFGMAVTPFDDVLLVPNSTTLKQISGSTGKLGDSIYSISPLFPSSIHMLKNKKIFIGAKKFGPTWPAKGRRAVIMMDTDGVQQVTYEHDENNQPLFTYVRCLTSTNIDTIFVVDSLSDNWKGRVVVLGLNGDVVNGHPDFNTEDKPFKPVHLVTSPSDNVIVSNLNNDLLYILNSVGLFITYCDLVDIGIRYPLSLSFTNLGQLYIGCTTDKGSTNKAKLYQVEITGV